MQWDVSMQQKSYVYYYLLCMDLHYLDRFFPTDIDICNSAGFAYAGKKLSFSGSIQRDLSSDIYSGNISLAEEPYCLDKKYPVSVSESIEGFVLPGCSFGNMHVLFSTNIYI